jgi:hypothetical protein
VNILAGLVWLEPHVAEALLKLHCLSPIDGCTYLGVDSGESSLQVILFLYGILKILRRKRQSFLNFLILKFAEDMVIYVIFLSYNDIGTLY